MVNQPEVAACKGNLEDDFHVLGLRVPLDAALEARNGALLVEGVQAPVYLAALVLAAVESFDHLSHDVLLGPALLGL